MTLASTRYPDLADELTALAAKDNLRRLTLIEKRESKFAWVNGRRLLNLSSNDYLGLAARQDLQSAFLSTCRTSSEPDACGLGASSSRLLTGNLAPYTRLETKLAALFHREAALIFNSGYHANLGILQAVLGSQDTVFSDRLNHASLIDGVRLSGAKLYRYPHLDYAHLEALLAKHRSQARRALILTESVFSMDGDCADIARLAELKKRFDARLYVDEAHAFGVFGPQGLGLCETQQAVPEVDFLVGTFGKALAAIGAFVVADRVVVDYLINKVRPFIFTTALPPIELQWLEFLLERWPEFAPLRQHLLALGQALRQALAEAGLNTRGVSQIIPVMLGDNSIALRAALHLQASGFLLFAIRPPTVPEGSSRLRISLSANMAREDLQTIPELIRSVALGAPGD